MPRGAGQAAARTEYRLVAAAEAELFARLRTFAYAVRRGQATAYCPIDGKATRERVDVNPSGYLFGSYLIATAPDANSYVSLLSHCAVIGCGLT